jgi:hypothetical protein
MKKIDVVVKDYVSKLSFDNLKYLVERFSNRIGPDLSECIDFISKNPEIDKLLSATKSGPELWTVVDLVALYVDKELSKRVPDMVSH